MPFDHQGESKEGDEDPQLIPGQIIFDEIIPELPYNPAYVQRKWQDERIRQQGFCQVGTAARHVEVDICPAKALLLQTPSATPAQSLLSITFKRFLIVQRTLWAQIATNVPFSTTRIDIHSLEMSKVTLLF